MKNVKLAFIGGGNMASSLIGGLVADHVDPKQISVADINDNQRENLAARYSVSTSADNQAIAAEADVVILAIKPQQLKSVCEELAPTIQQNNSLVVSIAAGIRSDDINKWLGGNAAVVRAMPNTPALVQTGATALFGNAQVSSKQRDLAESILRAAGLTLWVEDELQMDAVTALSGSGPAYFFRIMEAIESAGVELGLTKKTAHLLTLQTALGAAKMALESHESVAKLREQVTSPGGTTEQGLAALEKHNIDAVFSDVLKAARDRSEELAKILSES
ncbi:MAG: pyrroline-5-carboxylate reductase [Gammaproteobacteria bacterium]